MPAYEHGGAAICGDKRSVARAYRARYAWYLPKFPSSYDTLPRPRTPTELQNAHSRTAGDAIETAPRSLEDAARKYHVFFITAA